MLYLLIPIHLSLMGRGYNSLKHALLLRPESLVRDARVEDSVSVRLVVKSIALFQELPQHILQYSSMTIILNLDF